ncbi:MAG: hypothetical protein UZ18_ATM001000886 [Armatimonadetes bacterium OLB18]|nr:MAG: hypothetical protein UZ18_ATM001000886 [Armatimonadetes bacterium OLB18]
MVRQQREPDHVRAGVGRRGPKARKVLRRAALRRRAPGRTGRIGPTQALHSHKSVGRRRRLQPRRLRGPALLGCLAWQGRLGPLCRLRSEVLLRVWVCFVALRAVLGPCASEWRPGSARRGREVARQDRQGPRHDPWTRGDSLPSDRNLRRLRVQHSIQPARRHAMRDRALPQKRVLQGGADLATQRLLARAELVADRLRRGAEGRCGGTAPAVLRPTC